MKTFTTLRNTIAGYCKVSTSNTTEMAKIDANLNDSIRTICNIQGGKLRFLEAVKSISAVSGQEGYQVPNSFRKIIDLQIYSGTGSESDTIYSPEMIFDPTKWKLVLQYRLSSSDVPQFVYVQNQQYLVRPIPLTSGHLHKIRGRLRVRDLSIADYTTGSIVSIANGATTVTGTGTVWTADMTGRFIQITETTATNGGDGFWYEIGSVTSGTILELLKPYEGTTISAATAAYTMGQASVIPEAYDVAICYRSAAVFWQDKPDIVRAKTYWLLYDGGNEAGYSRDIGGLIGQMIENEGETEEGAYLPPFGRQANLPQAPYYDPRLDATGF